MGISNGPDIWCKTLGKGWIAVDESAEVQKKCLRETLTRTNLNGKINPPKTVNLSTALHPNTHTHTHTNGCIQIYMKTRSLKLKDFKQEIKS